MIAGYGLAHINKVWFVVIQYIELAHVSMHELSFLIKPVDAIDYLRIRFRGIFQADIPELGIRHLILAEEGHDEDVPVPDHGFGNRYPGIPCADKVCKLLPRPGKDELLFRLFNMREAAIARNVGTHGGKIRGPDSVDLDSNGGSVPLTIKDVRLLSRADGTADHRDPFLVDQLVEGKEGDLVEDVLPNLELVSVFYPDAHLFEALVELILFLVKIPAGAQKEVTVTMEVLLDIFPDGSKDPDERFTAGLLEIKWMHFTFPVRCFKVWIGYKDAVTAKFLGSFYGNFRKAGENMVLEDLEDRILRDLGRTERFLALLPNLVLGIGD